MTRLLRILAPLALGLTFASQASALPPDPGNTCGGSGACMYEANDLELWDEACEQAQQEAQLAHADYMYCAQTQSPGCSEAMNAYVTALMVADIACEEMSTAQDALEACLYESCE